MINTLKTKINIINLIIESKNIKWEEIASKELSRNGKKYKLLLQKLYLIM